MAHSAPSSAASLTPPPSPRNHPDPPQGSPLPPPLNDPEPTILSLFTPLLNDAPPVLHHQTTPPPQYTSHTLNSLHTTPYSFCCPSRLRFSSRHNSQQVVPLSTFSSLHSLNYPLPLHIPSCIPILTIHPHENMCTHKYLPSLLHPFLTTSHPSLQLLPLLTAHHLNSFPNKTFLPYPTQPLPLSTTPSPNSLCIHIPSRSPPVLGK